MLRITAATIPDLAAVLDLEQECVEAPHWRAADYEAIVAREGPVRRCLLLAKRDTELVGFAVGGLVGEDAELESVVVRGQARRGGVGRELCRKVMGWAVPLGATALNLEVRASSRGAIALYEGLGFVAIGMRQRYYSAPEDDAVLMRLEL